ncbi:hypothetical protein NOF55_01865 [Rhizobiaceae bacterium BDR2-2]|uniref:Anti-sigma factor n=1 Tax=Ectorhizobium quercum TaxID=2965071 RepID=A0AAE3MWR8_9HYPH|nr:hypothetical protein [Ectorhizobium quercum]MCX8995846.1 hypothetical protein [Ectorhizobium quercum]
MTVPVGGTGSGAHDEVLAGEYVLGVLPADTARQVESRVRTDRHFAAMVRRWQENLSDCDDGDADPWMLAGSDRVPGARLAPGFSMSRLKAWQSFAFWRGFGFAALGLLALYAVIESRNTVTAPAAPVEAAASVLTPVYDPAAGRIIVDIATPAKPFLNVWLIERAGQAHLLGKVPANGTVALDADMKQRLADGASIAAVPVD